MVLAVIHSSGIMCALVRQVDGSYQWAVGS